MTHFLTDNANKKNEYNIPEPVNGIEAPSTKIEVVLQISTLALDKKRTSGGIWQKKDAMK
jgi:5-formyltetrahydrofolate cyclo-ligase